MVWWRERDTGPEQRGRDRERRIRGTGPEQRGHDREWRESRRGRRQVERETSQERVEEERDWSPSSGICVGQRGEEGEGGLCSSVR